MELITPEENVDLNNDLLETNSQPKSPKRGSKEELIHKIVQLNEAANLDLVGNISKLRRKTKGELNKILAECVEASMKQKIADTIGADSTNETVMNVCFLRMIHDTLCMTAEKIGDPILQRRGYSIEGYTNSLKSPHISEQLDQCLQEIAQDTDILQYVQSPYARLAFLHLTCLATTIKTCSQNKQHAPPMEYNRTQREHPIRSSILRGTSSRKIADEHAPRQPVVRSV